jgi:hypothetical protein
MLRPDACPAYGRAKTPIEEKFRFKRRRRRLLYWRFIAGINALQHLVKRD